MSTPGHAGISPVAEKPGWLRWLAFAFATLLIVGGVGYTWLGASIPAGTGLSSGLASRALTPSHDVAPVMDQAGVLAAPTENQLLAKLVALRNELGPQMIVLTVSSLGGQSIDTYAQGWFNRAGLGDAKRNDGVLLIIAPNQRQVRIEVGTGLTTALSNQSCQQIIDQMLPLFRAGQIDSATTAGVDGVIKTLRNLKEFLPGKAV